MHSPTNHHPDDLDAESLSSIERQASKLWFAPDGLTLLDICSLYAPRITDAERPTSALTDGTALERRERREAQRRLGATVRVLRVYGPLSAPAEGTEAA